MTNFKSKLVALVIGATMPGMAAATITHSFADRVSFIAAMPQALTLPINLPGVSPVFVSDFTIGGLTITGLDGGLAGNGSNLLSTELDSDTLILNFTQPTYGIGLFGGVTDLDFAYIDGELLVDLVGSGTAALIANGGAAFLGLRSDVAFTQVRVSLTSFDTGASSIGFVTLQDSVDQVAAVPEPASWMLLIAGFGIVGARLRTRRPSGQVSGA